MADSRQYLRIGLQGVDYLLPSTASYAIEKREHLELGVPGERVVAWRNTPAGRWPAYSVDADLNPLERLAWQRAVFLQAGPQPVGLVADELQVLSREEVRVEPFRPPGPAPTPAGHLFGGAWVRAGRAPALVFEPAALAVWLRQLGEAA